MDFTDVTIRKNNVLPFPGSNIRNSKLLSDHAGIGPIEREMKAALKALQGSTYKDKFDWSVYDQIAKKYAEAPPGGVFKSPFRLASWHPSCSHCLYAFKADTYVSGCAHDCAYCYSEEEITAHNCWNKPQPFPANLAEIRKIFFTVFETDLPSKWREVMEKRVPIRLGSMSDPFMWMDGKYGVTKEFLRILRHYKYPSVAFTKSDLIAHDDYLTEMDRTLTTIQFSIVGNNHSLARLIEPGAPSYQRRLLALEKLNKHNFRTTVRVTPLFPRFPDGHFSEPGLKQNSVSVREFPIYDDNFVRELSSAGVKSLIAGFVRFSPIAIKLISERTGHDLSTFFRKSDSQKIGDRRYSDLEISAYYRWFAKESAVAGVKFASCCYVSIPMT